MKVVPTAIEGVVILEPEVFGDARGYFFESYSQRRFDAEVRPARFVQDNESHSRYGVLRGLHFQKGRYSQSKLVRVVRGRVLDVAVDIRRLDPEERITEIAKMLSGSQITEAALAQARILLDK